MLFLPETYSKECVINHLDGVKSNNQVSNLECVTQSDNIKHAYANNLIVKVKKTAVIRVNDEGTIVGEFTSLTEAEKQTNVNRGLIFNAIKGRIVTGDSRWFENAVTLSEEINSQTYKTNFTRVYQVDLVSKQLVNSFDNYPMAQKATGICSSGICNAIHRLKQPATAGGYVWFNNRQAMEDFSMTKNGHSDIAQITNTVGTIALE